jgi:hypothetical protein
MADTDHLEDFRAYLARFEGAAGEKDFGDFVKFHGRLVKKLTYDEYCPRWEEFTKMKKLYDDTFARGDTINDAMVRVLKERAAELMLDPPI